MEGFTAQHASIFLTKERILAQKSIGKKGLTNSETISFVKKNKKIKKELFSKYQETSFQETELLLDRVILQVVCFFCSTHSSHMVVWVAGQKDVVRLRQQQKHFGGGGLRSQ